MLYALVVARLGSRHLNYAAYTAASLRAVASQDDSHFSEQSHWEYLPSDHLEPRFRGPAGKVAGQIKTIGEKKPEEGAPAPPPAEAAAAPAAG